MRVDKQQAAVALRRALFGVGPVATGRAVLRRALRLDRAAGQPGGASQPGQTHPFDAEHGVDTGGFRSWRELQSGGANDPYISGYLGIAPSVARQVIGLVEDPGEYAFVDLGCGKGRALIIASERPFRRVIGVEIAAELAEAARRNAATMRERHPERTPIEVVHGDAAALRLPPGPLVLFLYQPFELPVMRAVARTLAASLAESPRPALVIYVHPVLARVFDRMPLLERAHEGSLLPTAAERPFSYAGQGGADDFVIWRTRPPAAGLAG